MQKVTERGIRPTKGRGWIALERDIRAGQVTRERLLDSFSGPGSKARAIRAAGTNKVMAS